jgi:hypothetical protein
LVVAVTGVVVEVEVGPRVKVAVGVIVLVDVASVEVVVTTTVSVAVPPPAHGLNGLALLRGVGGVITVKSVALLSASIQPPPARMSLALLPGAGAGPLPSKLLAVVP